MLVSYLRVSTGHQDLDVQRAKVDNYCAVQFSQLPDIELADVQSGATINRPQFNQLIGMIETGKVKTLVVYEFSRISRDLTDTANFLALCKRLSVDLHVVSDDGRQSNTTTIDQFVGITKGLASSIEREKISQRTKAGLELARSKGVKLGAPAGNSNRAGKYKKYDTTTVDQIKKLLAEGLTYRKISGILGIGLSTIGRIVKREIRC